MPTDRFAGDGADSASELAEPEPDAELVFAAHDLGRDRPPGGQPDLDEHDFATHQRASEGPPPADNAQGSFVPGGRDAPEPPALGMARRAAPHPPTPTDAFVISEPDGVAPLAPVDALVVGATAAPTGGDAGFHLSSASASSASQVSTAPLWVVRDPSPTPVHTASRRGWSTRNTQVVDRSAHTTMLRLREEAVHVSWTSAWIAVTSADRRLSRKRDF